MAAYRLLIKPSAAKELVAIGTKRDRKRIVARINELATEPRPPESEKLAGHVAMLRLRQGNYRVIYVVDDLQRSIDIIKIGHRRDVYRGRS